MRERPILFSAPMVRAILAGTKTQTRRVVKGEILSHSDGSKRQVFHFGRLDQINGLLRERQASPLRRVACPFGQVGDRLWVREAWRTTSAWDITPPRDLPGCVDLHYEADGRPNAHFCFGKLRPGMFMPRGASRITLEITGVRVERLQDISEANAIAEGIERGAAEGYWKLYGRDANGDMDRSPRVAYRSLWESINGPDSWDANPWVWVLEFKKT